MKPGKKEIARTTLAPHDLEAMLDEAARRGATRVLAEVGMTSGKASRDIEQLRDLLEAWRLAKKTVAITFLRVITTLILLGIAAWIGFTVGGN